MNDKNMPVRIYGVQEKATYTKNYNLKKPDQEDFYNIQVHNNNMDILDNAIKKMILDMHPIGTIYMSVADTNPSKFLGGTWIPWGYGRVPVCVNPYDSDFNAPEKTIGSKTHELTLSEIPSHFHSYTDRKISNSGMAFNDAGGAILGFEDRTTGSAGGGIAHNNIQPSITCYMWKRTE